MSDIPCQMEWRLLHNVIILISNADGLVPWFTKN